MQSIGQKNHVRLLHQTIQQLQRFFLTTIMMQEGSIKRLRSGAKMRQQMIAAADIEKLATR